MESMIRFAVASSRGNLAPSSVVKGVTDAIFSHGVPK